MYLTKPLQFFLIGSKKLIWLSYSRKMAATSSKSSKYSTPAFLSSSSSGRSSWYSATAATPASYSAMSPSRSSAVVAAHHCSSLSAGSRWWRLVWRTRGGRGNQNLCKHRAVVVRILVRSNCKQARQKAFAVDIFESSDACLHEVHCSLWQRAELLYCKTIQFIETFKQTETKTWQGFRNKNNMLEYEIRIQNNTPRRRIFKQVVSNLAIWFP